MIKIFPYKMGSASARRLAEALGATRVKPDGRYRPRPQHIIVNWGNSKAPNWIGAVGNARVLNSVAAVSVATNKLHAFQKLRDAGVTIPEFTTEPDVAAHWVDNGYTVVARTILNGHSGAGIHLMNQETSVINGVTRIVPAPLYVKYVKKQHEFRVHVFNGQVIDVQQKKRARDFTGLLNNQIRNHQNGWIYAREDVQYDPQVTESAINAVAALELDFGAVDIIWNNQQRRGYVLEVNTAPGLEGTSVQQYTQAIQSIVHQR